MDKASGKYFYFLAACARVTDDLKSRLAGAPLVFFDGTVWRDDELIAAGLGSKTGQGMGHIAMSGDHGAIESLAGLDIGRKMFLHINNSNPALLRGFGRAQDRRAARAGKSPPTERRSRCERRAPLTGMTALVDRQGHHRSTAPRNWRRRSARSAPRAITACIRFTGSCTAASSTRARCRPGR